MTGEKGTLPTTKTSMHSSRTTPKPPRSLLHPSLLRPNHLLRLPSRISSRINLHLIAPAIHTPIHTLTLTRIPIPIPIPIPLRPRPLLPSRIATISPIHQPRRAPLPQLIDRANRINSRMQRPSRIEILLDGGQQIGVPAHGFIGRGIRRGFDDERVGEGLVGGHAGVGVSGEAAFDEVAGGERDAAPVFERGEAVVGDEDCLHFFEVGVPVEGGVAAEEEVGYYAYGPDVAFEI